MSKRYEQWGYESYRDKETGLVASNHIEVMNEQDQKIKDLEHRLSNCIEPKFKKGDKCYARWGREIREVTITNIPYYYDVKYNNGYTSMFPQYQIFSTEKEAIKDLEELMKC